MAALDLTFSRHEHGWYFPDLANIASNTRLEHQHSTKSPAGEGVGESQFRRLEKKLSTLSTLWEHLSSSCQLHDEGTVIPCLSP
jgi:hypothetical protein